ncbi:hypothetical protein NP493_3235g00000 [Ridgeia piscesae]|uniref:Fucolectin tachylectin-4 pentraxin-1 domain-containing protein n=1 Tax=Ridgeia piscesae TaxID=27915 RepID=A0AAD9J8N9_RIDPI|nr:hypothetical protein NP493_3235g00000 [Ridgeia piscesae]
MRTKYRVAKPVWGARCRFARSSASQGSCIFPCRCTNGCHTTTGQCIDGGQCTADKPDKPTDLGWRWTGMACQEGNVAYNKAASQSIDPYGFGGTYPAGRAVDGDTNPSMAAGHCAHPDTDWGKNAWWMVDLKGTYNLSRVMHTQDWTHSYLAPATLRKDQHTNSARVTTAEYPQEELLNRSAELLLATSASVEMEVLIHI